MNLTGKTSGYYSEKYLGKRLISEMLNIDNYKKTVLIYNQLQIFYTIVIADSKQI